MGSSKLINYLTEMCCSAAPYLRDQLIETLNLTSLLFSGYNLAKIQIIKIFKVLKSCAF